MKSIADYVALEPEFYQGVLNNFEGLFKELDQVKNVKTVVIFATGSSSNAAYGARPFMSEVLKKPVFIEEPSMAVNYLYNNDPDTLYLAISQGGHSYSIIHLIEEFEKNGQTIYALTSNPDSPLNEVSNKVLSMGMPIEEMPYVSAGYSVTILDLMLIALKIGVNTASIEKTQFDDYLNQMKNITEFLPEVIKKSQNWVNNRQDLFVDADRIIFIGYGATYGMAREGETKFTETVHNTAFGKELEEYMHGPYIGLHSADRIVFIEPQGKLAPRAIALKEFLNKHVQNVITIYSDQDVDDDDDLGLNVKCDELLASLFMTVPIHLLSFKISQLKDHNLEKSTYPEFDEITKSKI